MKTKPAVSLRAVARLQKVFGVKGEMKILSYSRNADEYGDISGLFRGQNDRDVVPCRIENVKSRGNDIFLKLKDIDDPVQAKKIIGEYLFVEEDQRKKLPQGKYFDDELLDCIVVNEQGRKLGVVHDVVEYPAHKVVEVKTADGMVIVPMVDEIILSIDVKKKEIVVRPPEGLFDGSALE